MFTNNQKSVMTRSSMQHNPVRNTNAFSSRYLRAYASTTLPANYPVSAHQPATYSAPMPPHIRRVNDPPRSTDQPNPVAPPKKQMKWGEPTWNMFHTLAEKIKPEYYEIYRAEILDIINMVCNTLPCPICANHAVQHMKTIQEHKILTKADLQHVLWEFHNIVNERKGNPFFPKDQLQSKYSKANLRVVIQTFMFHHTDKGSGFRMVADDFYRSKIVKLLRDWFVKNIHIFDN